jgi:hypothetical protein
MHGFRIHANVGIQVLQSKHVIPVGGRGGLQRCGVLRILHCLDIRRTDDGEVVSVTHRPRCTAQKHFYLSLVRISIRGLANPKA